MNMAISCIDVALGRGGNDCFTNRHLVYDSLIIMEETYFTVRLVIYNLKGNLCKEVNCENDFDIHEVMPVFMPK